MGGGASKSADQTPAASNGKGHANQKQAVSEAAKANEIVTVNVNTVSMKSVGEDADEERDEASLRPQKIGSFKPQHTGEHSKEPETTGAKQTTPRAIPRTEPESLPFNQPAESVAPGQVHSPPKEALEPGAPAAPAPPPPPAEDDPWAALQEKYNPKANKSKATVRKGGNDEDDDFEMLAPGLSAGSEIETEYAKLTKPNGSKAVTPASGAVHANHSAPAQKPKGGDWGNGDLASAGTLMLSEMETAPPPSKLNQSLRKPHGHVAPPVDLDVVPKQAKLDDLGVADFDQSELDALMDDIESDNKLGDELAAKLARFEAAMDDD